MDLSTMKLETKNRSKTLVNVVETQNILLRRLVLKIEPEAEVIIGRDRYLELITSGSDLFSLSFSLLSVIHLSISATQCSTLDLDRPASTSQLVLKVTYNCETSAEKWYYRLWDLMMSATGAVYNTYSSGPKTDAWGTPQVTVRVVDLLPSIWTKGLEQPRQWHLWHLSLLIIISLIAYQAMFMYVSTLLLYKKSNFIF